MEKYITVVTPTYNRGYKLPSLLQSLRNQTNKNFNWLLINDGSTDNTEEIISNWNISEFTFQYIKQENGGKHRALNKAISYVETKFVFIVDSDDYLLEDAIANIENWIREIENNLEIAAVSGLRIYPDGKKLSGFPKKMKEDSFIIANNFERWRIGLTGDQAEIYRAELLKKFSFPEFEGENFISESVVWDKIASEGYKVKWINKPIYVCEYLDDGLTKNLEEIEIKNFQGFTYTMRMSISYLKGWVRFKDIAKYIRISRKKGLGIREISKRLDISPLSTIVGYIMLYIYIVFQKLIKSSAVS